jgi:hypothetical protein
MLPWRTASNTPTPSEPLPEYTGPKLPTSREETNNHTRVDHSSTNSSLVDIELGNMPTPSEPPPTYSVPSSFLYQEETNNHAWTNYSSTNSPFDDIELDNILPPRPARRVTISRYSATTRRRPWKLYVKLAVIVTIVLGIIAAGIYCYVLLQRAWDRQDCVLQG